MSNLTIKSITINGMKISYTTRGTGPAAVLLIHGAVGSLNDFNFQLSEEYGLNEREFTCIVLDLPGNGRSELVGADMKPCEPSLQYFALCEDVCAKLMSQLGHKTYVVGGWNDGARVAVLLAIKQQSRVSALLLWGFVPLMDRRSCNAIARVRDTSCWEPSVLETYEQVYGKKQFSELWRHYVDSLVKMLDFYEYEDKRFDIRDQLNKIKCPTLILHGSKDPIVDHKQHVEPVERHIHNSDVRQFKGLAHNIHQADPAQFGQVMARFFSDYSVASVG